MALMSSGAKVRLIYTSSISRSGNLFPPLRAETLGEKDAEIPFGRLLSTLRNCWHWR